MSLKKAAEGIWTWKWLSPEKGYFFNGTLVSDGKNKVLIDPVILNDEGLSVLKSHGPFDAIYLTNKDHERMAYSLRKEWKIPISIHELDKPFLKENPDSIFKDGHELLCGLKVVHLREQKSPGECVFYLPGKKILIAGDALIGHPAGSLNMLPEMKYADVQKAQAGLRRLFSLHFEMLLVGDGESVMKDAYQKLEDFFGRLR